MNPNPGNDEEGQNPDEGAVEGAGPNADEGAVEAGSNADQGGNPGDQQQQGRNLEQPNDQSNVVEGGKRKQEETDVEADREASKAKMTKKMNQHFKQEFKGATKDSKKEREKQRIEEVDKRTKEIVEELMKLANESPQGGMKEIFDRMWRMVETIGKLYGIGGRRTFIGYAILRGVDKLSSLFSKPQEPMPKPADLHFKFGTDEKGELLPNCGFYDKNKYLLNANAQAQGIGRVTQWMAGLPEKYELQQDKKKEHLRLVERMDDGTVKPVGTEAMKQLMRDHDFEGHMRSKFNMASFEPPASKPQEEQKPEEERSGLNP